MNKIDVDEITVEELSKGYNLFRKNGTAKPYMLYLPLYPEHKILAETFLLSNYEVNLINSFFLREWFHYGTGITLPLRIVMTHVSDTYFPLLKLFFDNNNEITYRQYFIFVCSFLFFSPSQILSLMVSMAKVTSKLFITKSQILSLFQSYNFKIEELPKIIIKLENNNNDNMNGKEKVVKRNYSLKLFCKTIQESDSFVEYINKLKEDILNFAIPRIIYNTITKKIQFYYENGINKIVPPKESCISRLTRLLITNAPYPYHFDYYIQNEQLSDGFDRGVMAIKRKFDEKNNSIASISSIHRRQTASSRLTRPMSTSTTSLSKSSRRRNDLSINLAMKSSKVVPFAIRSP